MRFIRSRLPDESAPGFMAVKKTRKLPGSVIYSSLKYGAFMYINSEGCNILKSGLSLRGGGWGSPLASKNVPPGYFHWKIEEKWNQNNNL